jgi:hypothetical protein
MRVANGVRRQLLSTALFGLIAPWIAVAGSSESGIPDRTPSNGPVQHAPMIPRERHGRYATSSNWSGYAVTGANDSVSYVQGSWQVPAIQVNPLTGQTCSSQTQYSSFWVGIDGYSSKTVEQIGTDSDCQNGSPTYYAWYEFYPKFAYNVPITINPGDVISAKVDYGLTVEGEFTVYINDETTQESWSHSEKVSKAERSSAEWIIEASGGKPLADFGSVTFGSFSPPCEATVSPNPNPAPIGSFAASDVVEITMETSKGTIMSQPSSLVMSDSFGDTWLNQGP